MVSRLSILRMPFGRADALPAPVVSAPQMMPPDGFNPLGSGPTEIRERPLCAELCWGDRSEEHTSELQSLMRISYAVFCLKKENQIITSLTYNIATTNTNHPTTTTDSEEKKNQY